MASESKSCKRKPPRTQGPSLARSAGCYKGCRSNFCSPPSYVFPWSSALGWGAKKPTGEVGGTSAHPCWCPGPRHRAAVGHIAKGGLSPGSGLAAQSRVGSRRGLFAAGGDEGRKIFPFPRWPEGAGATRISPHGRNDSVGASHRSNHKDRLSVENLSREGIKAAPCVPKRRGRERKRGQRATVQGEEGLAATSPKLGRYRRGLKVPCPSTEELLLPMLTTQGLGELGKEGLTLRQPH